MKKLLTLLLTLFLFSSVYAEFQTVNKLEYRDEIAYVAGENKLFNGKLVTTYSNNKKKIEINYKNGKQEGLDAWWYKSGQIGRESHYKNNKLNGLEIEWHANGTKESEINWKNGKKHGLHIRLNNQGKRISTIKYVNGISMNQANSKTKVKKKSGIETFTVISALLIFSIISIFIWIILKEQNNYTKSTLIKLMKIATISLGFSIFFIPYEYKDLALYSIYLLLLATLIATFFTTENKTTKNLTLLTLIYLVLFFLGALIRIIWPFDLNSFELILASASPFFVIAWFLHWIQIMWRQKK